MIQTFLFRTVKGNIYHHTVHASDLNVAIEKWLLQIDAAKTEEYSYDEEEVKVIRQEYDNGRMKKNLENEPLSLCYQNGRKPMVIHIDKVNKGMPDLIAKVSYLTTEEGGRKGAVSSGYRPLIKFEGRDELTSSEQIFVDKDNVFPGETAIAEIRIVSKNPFRKSMSAGHKFEIFDALRLVAHGELLEVSNTLLQK
ncbi:MAG: hypothetical protein QM731_25960 [Chitinophagaceae bacterium]